jgi:hypothetical protein
MSPRAIFWIVIPSEAAEPPSERSERLQGPPRSDAACYVLVSMPSIVRTRDVRYCSVVRVGVLAS